MNKTAKNLIYLLSCAVNGIAPDMARVQAMELEQLYQLSKAHTLRAAVYIALRSAGVEDRGFQQAYNKAVRKNVMLDVERTAIFERFEQHGIWYLPLKGSILKELYPENGMREMADNDVLYDSSKQAEVKDIMLEKGYTAESVGKSHHDVYMKQPVLNFELHTELVRYTKGKPLDKYYADTKRLLIKDEGNKYGYHFSDEDFYVYMTVHEYMHFQSGGTGIRSLLDCYVFCKANGNTLDWNYIIEQFTRLDIADFESARRKLAMKIFSSAELPELNNNEQELLEQYLNYGTYGTIERQMYNMLPEKSNFKNIIRNMFPSMEYMQNSVKFVKKFPFLYPVGVAYRWGRILLIRRNYLSVILKAMKKNGKKKV